MKLFEKEVDSEFLLDCYAVSTTTIALLCVLEALTWYDKEWQQKYTSSAKIRQLYQQAAISNLLHFVIIGPLAYAIMTAWIYSYGGSTFPFYISVPGTLLTQGIGYALAHAWMHIPRYYWIHKYHHVYNEKTFCRPIVANAVTLVEFVIAYALPIVVGGLLFRPSESDTYYIVMSISVANLAIHTPSSLLNMKYIPNFFCSNEKHFYHHERNVRKHYAAPIFDLDGILNCLYGNSSSHDNASGNKKSN